MYHKKNTESLSSKTTKYKQFQNEKRKTVVIYSFFLGNDNTNVKTREPLLRIGVLPLFTMTVLKSFSELASDAWKTRREKKKATLLLSPPSLLLFYICILEKPKGQQPFPNPPLGGARWLRERDLRAAICWGKKSDFKNVSLLDVLSVQNIFLWDDTQSNSARSLNDFAISLTDHYFGNATFSVFVDMPIFQFSFHKPEMPII